MLIHAHICNVLCSFSSSSSFVSIGHINIFLPFFLYDLIVLVKNLLFSVLFSVSPHHLYGSPTFQHYHLSQQIYDEQQPLAGTESVGVRSATLPQMAPINKTTRNETGETDESSIVSLDFAHADLVDAPGSWRYRSVPVPTAARRYRAPIPQSFLEQQQYASDSEQVVRSSSFRHPPSQPQQSLEQSRPFGSIPTINR